MTAGQSEPHPDTCQPVGLPVDTTPAKRPGPVILEGRFGRIEKLDPSRHDSDLWLALQGHDRIWTYMSSYGPFADEAAFAAWLTERAALEDPYCYAIVDTTGRTRGLFALWRIRPDIRVVEVGHVVYAPSMQRTPLATEAQYLLARYVFETLGYRRYEWKCNALNAASRRAAERLGFTFEGIFRQETIAKGRNRDTAWFSMLDSEWPMRKAVFERWLKPENFDAEGKQKTSLSTLMSDSAQSD
jgi:RimJ/RimL family protein N-acetyltransferase